MAKITDLQLAVLSSAVYSDEEFEDGPAKASPCKGFTIFTSASNDDSGLGANLYIKKTEDGQGLAVFSFRGTDSSKSSSIMGQMRSNWLLMQDPDDDLDIIKQGLEFADKAMHDLEIDQIETEWHFFSTGHSLGALMATALAIQQDSMIERCVTFESPGLVKVWRKKAEQRGEDHWKKVITNYLTFPNPINTTLPKVGRVVRIQLDFHSTTSTAHVMRCLLGTCLRAAVWGSVANLALSMTGRAKGFWAAKVLSVSAKAGALIWHRRFNVKKAIHELRRAADEDQASKDTRSAAESGRPEDDEAMPLVPLLSRLPARARGGLLTGVWALGTIGVSSTSYIATRTSGNLADCANEHNIAAIIAGFDEETGEPKDAIEMHSWPYHDLLLKKSFSSKHSRRLLSEGLLPLQPAAYGLHNALRRHELLLRRARSLPGYREAPQAA